MSFSPHVLLHLLTLGVAIASPLERRSWQTELTLAYEYSVFTTTIKVGTPGQPVKIMLDTAATPLWFYTANGGFNPALSSGTSPAGSPQFNPYLNDATGTWRREAVDLGGRSQSFPALVGAVDQMGYLYYANLNITGNMGLAPSGPVSSDPYLAAQWWTTTLATVLPSPRAGLKLTNDAQGKMTLGYLDPAHYTGELKWFTTCDPTSYMLRNLSYSFNGVHNVAASNIGASQDILLDTGGIAIWQTREFVAAYYALVPSAVDVNGDGTYWQVPCTTALPDISIDVGAAAGAVQIKGALLLDRRGADTTNVCTTRLKVGPRLIYGGPLFQSNYVALDWAGGVGGMGFAQQR